MKNEKEDINKTYYQTNDSYSELPTISITDKEMDADTHTITEKTITIKSYRINECIETLKIINQIYNNKS